MTKLRLLLVGTLVAIGNALMSPSDLAVAQSSMSYRLPIPPSATVLTLTGLNFNLTNYMPGEFRGRFSRPPYRMLQVRYPASIGSKTISLGVVSLDSAMHNITGPIIVLAHSQGAQVASHWMREHADDPTAPGPDRLTFVLLGNPLRSSGGRGIGRHEFGGTIGEPTPTTTRWTVVDVARRYDGWADWPADASNQLAVRNAHRGMTTYHTHYDEVDLDDCSHTIWKSGNTTFVLTHETLPIWRGAHTPPENAVRTATAYVESAYDRPPNDPKITAVPIAGKTAWQAKLRLLGVPVY